MSAVPCDIFKRLLPKAWAKMPYFRQVDKLGLALGLGLGLRLLTKPTRTRTPNPNPDPNLNRNPT